VRTIRRFLIVTATGECRIVTRWPNVRVDEVAYRLNITIPDAWGRLLSVDQSIDVTLPEPPDVSIGELVRVPNPISESEQA
jgi:hypothetical protein